MKLLKESCASDMLNIYLNENKKNFNVVYNFVKEKFKPRLLSEENSEQSEEWLRCLKTSSRSTRLQNPDFDPKYTAAFSILLIIICINLAITGKGLA